MTSQTVWSSLSLEPAFSCPEIKGRLREYIKRTHFLIVIFIGGFDGPTKRNTQLFNFMVCPPCRLLSLVQVALHPLEEDSSWCERCAGTGYSESMSAFGLSCKKRIEKMCLLCFLHWLFQLFVSSADGVLAMAGVKVKGRALHEGWPKRQALF